MASSEYATTDACELRTATSAGSSARARATMPVNVSSSTSAGPRMSRPAMLITPEVLARCSSKKVKLLYGLCQPSWWSARRDAPRRADGDGAVRVLRTGLGRTAPVARAGALVGAAGWLHRDRAGRA